jgi:hypothetical protein
MYPFCTRKQICNETRGPVVVKEVQTLYAILMYPNGIVVVGQSCSPSALLRVFG